MAAKSWPRAARRVAIASRPSRRSPGGPPRATWDRAARLVRKADFEAVYRGGGRAGGRLKSPQFVVFYGANGSPRSRFGISVKKALGNAVVRNRIRRRIREILRRNSLEIPSGWDCVMHPRRTVASSDFAALQAELVGLLRGLPALKLRETGLPRPVTPSGTQTPHPVDPSGTTRPPGAGS